MENNEPEIIEDKARIKKLEGTVAQMGVVIDKFTAVINTISSQLTTIQQSVMNIQKKIDEYNAPSEYFI